MKKISVTRISALFLILLSLMWIFNGCKKDTDGSPDVPAGTPVFESITPTEGPVTTMLTLKGQGLGQIVSIIFDMNNAPAVINPNLNTETSILFRVPDTAFRGQQNIILTNVDGKTLAVPFDVLAYSIVNSAFPTDFQSGSTITLTGNNLDVCTKVLLEGTTDEAEILSSSLNTAVIKMPTSDVNKCRLVLTSAAGDRTTDLIFINIDKALPVFTDGLMNGFESWSWGGTFETSSDYAVTGTSSMKAAYDPAGTWGGLQLGNGGSINVTEYRYFTFWVRGADVEKKMQFWINWADQKVDVVIPAGVWTYYKYDLITDYPTIDKTMVNNITFQMYEEGHTVYFDNIVFIKE